MSSSLRVTSVTDSFNNLSFQDANTGVQNLVLQASGVTRFPSGSLPTFSAASGSQSSTMQYAVVTLTAANLIAMNGAPVSILPAPGAGTLIIVGDVLFEMTATSTQFTGGGAVSFVYHGTATAVVFGSIPASVITATAGATNTLLGDLSATNGTTIPANVGVDITNATAAFAAGTGTAIVQIWYSVVTL